MIIIEDFFDIICYNIGYWLIKLITFGKHPTVEFADSNYWILDAAGFLVFIIMVIGLAYLF